MLPLQGVWVLSLVKELRFCMTCGMQKYKTKLHHVTTSIKKKKNMNKEHKVIFKEMFSMYAAAATAAKSLQSCPTLCDPIDGGPPGSPIPGILQARTLVWVAISFSNAWKGKVKVKSLSRVRLFTTPWSAAYQAPPSMGFSRQEYWSGVPLPSPFLCIIHYNSWSVLRLHK